MRARSGTTDPPTDFDDLVDRFDRLSSSLVLLEPHSLPEVRGAIEALETGLSEHLAEGCIVEGSPPRGGVLLLPGRIEAEHRHFLTSLDQLWWLYRIVQADDHGGNRQALGQYGRLVAESLRLHRADERALGSRPSVPGRPASARRRAGKAK